MSNDIHRFANIDLKYIENDKHIFALNNLPLITIYDDNFFVRNDYDILSLGQRQYLINFFIKYGFTVKSGKLLQLNQTNLHFPTPSRLLAVSTFAPCLLKKNNTDYYCVTPTTFAECLFYRMAKNESEQGSQAITNGIEALKQLINTCPFNIEYLRDISYRNPIEQLTIQHYAMLKDYQQQVIAQKFKRKKAL
ncbi:hypothetical protein [Thalassotalea aquiviva]|uniref:hypothetical protein n=1 Tax=Thalassotalea aquiviva TaxID=3242415 RepID=UPI00352B9F70